MTDTIQKPISIKGLIVNQDAFDTLINDPKTTKQEFLDFVVIDCYGGSQLVSTVVQQCVEKSGNIHFSEELLSRFL